ncbi:MAG: bifunctional 5,10-methylene-tetrahydrofolate dehydrogenase/5,10-methylene-tetrahydrofolate cyclohydrolase [Bacteroidetes bacterium GWF2_38_335]|nr:MAG: bifunctional 5,10-methylene-tetrahydrofolate dehydrogenase/5,10-methylene-tetrahydrofolate cyclohydrolase [Bacteroidetes bacterium GWF2_38_335]OFY77457.1 MAG: bifunctional 5,10-methylene-tetrahydrofolate dehydrogenase/5,10-methylene-tetrahydrofolate cyclohydrolase [Bacteroidetes bacterium RIFOXYA12_FULL_38_20]HBS87253.1 bifunctional 5,10-methylene-tetrahydrofolate dehydrogenase/5,10-methylene-tetrahydrofolate cyclohydrolase [Bacteroidales bacterium]
MILIDGKEIAIQVKNEIAEEVKKIIAQGGKVPHLAAILVGEDGASQTYVNSKVKSCEEVGFKSTLLRYDASFSEAQLIEKIYELNNDDDIDGYIVQLPLPKHIDEDKINMLIDPKKDVDGFHPVNVGRMSLGLPSYISATPAGVLELLARYNIDTQGKHCVVLGRSNIVGRPMSILMSQKGKYTNCTVTVCHSKTENLKELCNMADILIVAIGIPEFVKADMVKPGAVVIDVGIHRLPAPETKSGFKLKGDVKFDEVAPKCSYISPVPGGVGLMTVVSLLKNTLLAAKGEIYK